MTLTAPGTPAAEKELPHWESAPDDLPAAIREIKAALRARIEASGRSVREVFGVIEARVRAQVEEIAADKARGATVWPVIDYADIEAGTVSAEDLAALHRRGCLVVRGHFGHAQALGWDQERPPGRSTKARPCAPRSGRSRAGPRCRTWTTTRACCTPSPSPRRWAT